MIFTYLATISFGALFVIWEKGDMFNFLIKVALFAMFVCGGVNSLIYMGFLLK